MYSPKLILKTENEEEYVFELREGQVLFAGRTAECDICLPSPAVSRRHAILVMRGGKCGLKDMGSGNGTFLNGKRLEGPVKLRDGDIIQIATHRLQFVAPPQPVQYKKAAETLVLPPDMLLQRLGERENNDTQRQAAQLDQRSAASALASGRSSDPVRLSTASGSGASESASAAVPAAPARPAAPLPQPQTPGQPPAPASPPVTPATAGAPSAPPAPKPPAASAPVKPAVSRSDTDEIARKLLPQKEQSEGETPDNAAQEKSVSQRSKRPLDPNTVRRVRESIRLTPKAPPAPKVTTEASEDEIGDGAGYTGMRDVIPHEENDKDKAALEELSKKAADAGLIGQFEPEHPELHDLMDVKETLEADDDGDDEEEHEFEIVAESIDDDEEEDDSESSTPEEDGVADGEHAEDDTGEEEPAASSEPIPLPALQIQPSESSLTNDLLPLPPEEANPDGVPISPAFRQAIESRLFYYSFIEDLRREREELLAANPDAPDNVKSEVDRQNREMAKPPNADQAADRIQKVNARRDALRDKIRKAKEAGTALPPRPSKLMREVEDIGINQWTIIAQSLRESLPAAFEAGYGVVAKEPLAPILEKAEINARALMGGSAYCLALEELLAEAKFNRAVVKEKIVEMPPPDEKKGGGGGFLSKFRHKNNDEEDGEEEDSNGDTFESLTEDERLLGLRCAWITQEMEFAELLLIKEFWDVYLQVALKFLPNHREMDMCVRAFLRHGVIGFSRWWLKEPVRRFVQDDCTNEIRHEFEVGQKITNVVYAEEYLIAVMEERCTPAMDENLEINEKNSPNWKADKALRKLISTKAQMARTKELLDSLQARIDKNEQEAAVLEERIKALLPGSKNFKKAKQELSQDRQAYRIEISKLNKLAEKLRESMEGELQEAVTDTEERFNSGELPRPTKEFLIEREVGQVRRIGRLTANLKEKLLPLAMREYQIDTDAANDRLAIIGELADIERRDPRLFLETIVPSKKKANRVDMRICPVVVLLPAAGILAFAWNPRQKPEDGRLALPTFFTRQRIRERQVTYLMSDFRWDTAKASAGMDLMNSETIVAEFMRVRWDWRKRSKEMREKGLVYTEQNDRTNWRRVYEAYLSTAFDGGKKLFNRNYDFYERIVGKYFDMPEGVDLLRK